MELISKKAKISLYLDTRRALNDGTYPLKIRAYYGKPRLFEIDRSLTEDDFERSYLAKKPRGQYYQQLKIELAAIEANANEVVDSLKVFTFEKFKKKLFASPRSMTNMVDHYEVCIEELEESEQDGTASSYLCAINSIKAFVNQNRKRPTEVITFDVITPEFLKAYENWMVEQRDLSRTTVGIYLRTTRKIFNAAIDEGIIDKEIYPFKKYKIPTGKNTKKAIESSDLKDLFNADTKGNPFQEKAKAFWFFSYQCNGMNIRDICELKFKNIHGSHFSFLRQKTIRTIKEDPKPIIVPITPYVKEVIRKYGNPKQGASDYIFPIFEPGMDSREKRRVNQNFTRFINQHMKKMAEDNELELKTGTMEARHSFTTQVTRKKGLEFAQEALGHASLTTTQNYWAGFESDTKREMADMLMDFDEPKQKRRKLKAVV